MYNIYSELNKITDYIEEHLLEEIDVNYLAHLSGLNISMLKNIFTCLTGISIIDYIRYRRLSLAVSDILNNESITDISYKYLYSSPASFSRSFKMFMGISPNKVKNSNTSLKLYNKIVFQNSINDYSLDYKIIKEKEFILYGVSRRISNDNVYIHIRSFWKDVKREYPEFNADIRYGFLKRINKEEANYYCLLDKKFPNSQEIRIPKHKYFAFTIPNDAAKMISESIKKGVNEYIKSLNYQCALAPNIELYYDDSVQILIPII